MSGLLPSAPDVSVDGDPEPRVIGLDSDDASDMLAALSSETARSVLSVLHEEPATPSAIADRVDTSLQNVQYHLEKLEQADLVDQVGTQYSEKGREMTLYGPADGPLVVFPGSTEEASGFKQLLRRVMGAVILLGAVSAVIEAIAREWIPGLTSDTGVPGDDAAVGDDDDAVDDSVDAADDTDDAPDEVDAADDDDGAADDDDAAADDAADPDDDPDPPEDDATDPDDGPDEIDVGPDPDPVMEDPHWLVETVVELPPGLAFFLGGCLVLLILVGLWYWHTARYK